MILADKIIALRKKNGWSQEELAEQLSVSRQSVSKWEGAQAVPDLQKILRMTELFGVTTDYLLKDELGEEEYMEAPIGDAEAIRRVSMEEANEFLTVKEATSKKIALATFMCILSPICMLLLGAAAETGVLSITEDFAGGIGMCVLLLIVAPAVAIFIYCGSKTEPFSYLETEVFETEYGVSGMVKERQKRYKDTYTKFNIIGTSLCVLSLLPLFIGASVTENEMFLVIMLCILLVIAGIGVIFFVIAGIRWESMKKLLQEGDYTAKKKRKSSLSGTVATVYWMLATAVFLTCRLLECEWKEAGFVWPVAGVAFVAVMAITHHIERRKEELNF